MSRIRLSSHWRSILLALLVTFLWSTSWVLIKFGLDEIPPLTFAGLRYMLAFLVLLPGAWKHKSSIRALPKIAWRNLVILGIVYYALTQGGAFVALNHLDAVTYSLMLSFTPLIVSIFGVIGLREIPTRWQWFGIVVFLTGILVYFYPLSGLGYERVGLLVGGLTVCANAAASVLGRYVNRGKTIPPLVVTVISMGVGGFILLGSGLILEETSPISPANWGIILWLAVVNTALAFTLWNQTLQRLSAVESSVVNNTMLIQITVLAWLFLGEQISQREVYGLVLAAIGILVVQVVRPKTK